MCDASEYSSLQVYMSSHMKYLLNIICKLERKIEKEPFHSILPLFFIHQIQLLLNKYLYFALKELLVFVVDYLSIDPSQLLQAISATETRDGGWIATVSQPCMNALDLQVPFVGILETMPLHQGLLFGIKSKTGSG
jgi:hypothetical protein